MVEPSRFRVLCVGRVLVDRKGSVVLKTKLSHKIIRWGLGIHGVVHIAEVVANVYEGAWISAGLSPLSGGLMLAGALTHRRL